MSETDWLGKRRERCLRSSKLGNIGPIGDVLKLQGHHQDAHDVGSDHIFCSTHRGRKKDEVDNIQDGQNSESRRSLVSHMGSLAQDRRTQSIWFLYETF